jgi:hypothetical protein
MNLIPSRPCGAFDAILSIIFAEMAVNGTFRIAQMMRPEQEISVVYEHPCDSQEKQGLQNLSEKPKLHNRDKCCSRADMKVCHY